MIGRIYTMFANAFSSSRHQSVLALADVARQRADANRKANENLESTVRDLLDEDLRLRVSRR